MSYKIFKQSLKYKQRNLRIFPYWYRRKKNEQDALFRFAGGLIRKS